MPSPPPLQTYLGMAQFAFKIKSSASYTNIKLNFSKMKSQICAYAQIKALKQTRTRFCLWIEKREREWREGDKDEMEERD